MLDLVEGGRRVEGKIRDVDGRVLALAGFLSRLSLLDGEAAADFLGVVKNVSLQSN